MFVGSAPALVAVAVLWTFVIMKRYTNMEYSVAVTGLMSIVIGIVIIVHPVEFTMIHDSTSGRAKVPALGPDTPVHVSKTGSRVYGVLCLVMGLGISCLALARGRK